MSLPKADYTALADEHLSCREFQHSWQQVGPYRVSWETIEGPRSKAKRVRLLSRTAKCIRCGTERVDRFNDSWDKRSARYAYVDGYQFKNVDRGHVSHEVHGEFFRRSTERYGVEGETSA